MHSYVYFALLSGTAYSLANLLQKHLVGKIDEYAVGWARYLFATPFLLLAVWYVGVPQVKPVFWLLVIPIGLLEILIAVLFAKALKNSHISKTIPFLAFNPLFIALGATLVLGESISLLQYLAMAMIVAGAYLLNVTQENIRDVFAPFKLIWKEKGGLYIIILCLIWGLDVPFSKMATLNSSPEFLSAVFFLITTIAFIPVFKAKSHHGLAGIRRNFLTFSVNGLLSAIVMVALFAAAKLGPVGVVSALTNVNILITVILAGALLKERNLKQRLLSALVMTIGAVILTIS